MKRPKLNVSPQNMGRAMICQKQNRREMTGAERHVAGLLSSIGERFTFEKVVLTKVSFYLVDFYLPKPRKLCIEVDGEYHLKQIEKDARRDAFLRNVRRMRVLRITNAEAFSMTKDSLFEAINRVAPIPNR